jgi:hypothetical protein
MISTLRALVACCLSGLLFFTASHAWAARPMITDDARIVDPKSCQLESWVRSFRGAGTEYWALPGCNPFGGFEFTLGPAHASLPDKQGDWKTLWQFKTLFKELETNGWGWGFALGNLSSRPYEPFLKSKELFVNVPISASFMDDKVVMHLNIGGAHTRGNSGSFAYTWGLGTEIELTEKIYLIAETYSQRDLPVEGQLGIRYWIVKDRVQVDATVGTELTGSVVHGRWFTIGLRLLSPAFLP